MHEKTKNNCIFYLKVVAMIKNDNPYDSFSQTIDRAAELLGLERSAYEFVKYPERELVVSIPVEMDDGKIGRASCRERV